MRPKTKSLRETRLQDSSRKLNTTLKVILLLLSATTTITFFRLKPAEAANIETIGLSRNPDTIKPYRYGSYSNPQPGIDQIRVDSPDRDGGAVAVSWSLEQLNLSTAKTIKLSFDLWTNVTNPGDFGPRIGASVGLSTSYANCCPTDRSAIFQKNAETTLVQVDCCYLGPRLVFDASRWPNPDASNSGDRVAKVCQEVFPGYANDAIWHSYEIRMNFTSHLSNWMVDGAMVTGTCASFSFVPTHVVFWAQGHDIGDSAISQLRNPRITVSQSEPLNVPPSNGSSDSPLSNWWFWAIAGLAATSGVLMFTNVRSRTRSKAVEQAVGQNKALACPQCGGQMPPNSTFCGKCGHRLDSVSPK